MSRTTRDAARTSVSSSSSPFHSVAVVSVPGHETDDSTNANHNVERTALLGQRRSTSERNEPLHESSTSKVVYPSSLDFERVVNQYSIQAIRDRIFQTTNSHVNLTDLTTSQNDNDNHNQGIRGYGMATTTSQQGMPAYSTFDPEFTQGWEDGKDGSKGSLRPPPPPPPPSLSGRRRIWSLRRRNNHNHTQQDFSGRSITRWCLTLLTGLLTGSVSIFIVTITDRIQTWRSTLMDSLWHSHKLNSSIFTLYVCINLTLAMMSAVLCIWLAPEAVGSGIPEVKAYLNGVRVKKFTSLRLLLVKIVGTILSISSGLVIGPEGPLVHVGAIMGASCTRLYDILLKILPPSVILDRRVWSFVVMDLSHFAKDSERRDLVSIGAAAGFAAAFGAPVGGLLFTLEEASSYFDQSMFMKTLAATALATFCLAVHHGDLSDYSIISLGNFQSSNDRIFLLRVIELPLYVVIATGGGLLGGLFCRSWSFLQAFRSRMSPEPRTRRIYNLFQVAAVSLLTSSLLYYVPLMDWSCRRVNLNDDLIVEKSFLDPWKWHPHQFDCPTGYINELATIFFGSREEAIASILTDPQQFRPATLWAVGIISFVLMTLTLGVNIPSGIFMPTFLIGTSMGGACGLIFQEWLGREISPSTFALLGAAALLAGIQRSTVSLCVILVEGTGQVKVLLPVIITVVVARWVGDLVSPHGLYEAAMEVSHYPYLPHLEQKRLDIFDVVDIMSAPPVTLGPRERVSRLVQLLQKSQHHGFPVVDPVTNKFLGLVRRDQIVALIECGIFDDGPDDDSSAADVSSAPPSPDWTPKPGVGKSPMMHLAYHITDDKYDHMEETGNTASNYKPLREDESDATAWLTSIRESVRQTIRGKTLQSSKAHHSTSRGSLSLGDESMPPIDDQPQRAPQRAAQVGMNEQGNLVIEKLRKDCRYKYLNLAAVMNRGTFCVSEHCPVSKAYDIFTALGLRHLIVVGGDTGGQVVGILTRINFLKEYIHERTGYDIGE